MLNNYKLLNLQQQNFVEIISKMSGIPGWEMLQTDNILALKSPGSIPLVNFVWGKADQDSLQQVKDFFAGNEFYWLLAQKQRDDLPEVITPLFNAGYAGDAESIFPEMLLDLNSYSKPNISSKISITLPATRSDLASWTNTAIATFGQDAQGFKDFFYPLIEIAGCVPFLIYYDNVPAATSLVYRGEKVAGIYAMSTLADFRNKGLGKAAVHACVALAKSHNLPYAVLYASKLGQHLYNKLGFIDTQFLHGYHFNRELDVAPHYDGYAIADS
jgi:ribosomal protein S18 acetylase RimI-like enzyme